MGCPKLAEGEVVRITRVDNCGRPVAGASNGVVSDCWAEVQMKPNVDAGKDINLKNAAGRSCAYKKACPDFLGFDITATFYEASPEMIEILTGNPIVFDHNAQPVGWDDCQIACAAGFALELWQSVITNGCPEGVSGEWFYWLMPWITNGLLGDLAWNDSGATFTLTGSTVAYNDWGLGPWDVIAQDGINTPGPLLTPLGAKCHRRSFLTTIAAPTAHCGYVTVPANNPS